MIQETLMDAAQFDTLTTRLTTHLTRRRSLGLLGILGVAAAGGTEDVGAKKKKKKKKKKGNKEPVCKENGAECWVGYSDSGYTSMCCSGQCRYSVCCTQSKHPCPPECVPDKPCAGCCLIGYCAASGVCA